MKKILVINGHPDKDSYCTELAFQYNYGAKSSGAVTEVVNLIDLDFSPVLKYGYRKRTELEPDLVRVQEKIKEADHLVFVYPTWWGTQPALLKGFIDRVFLPGFAFSYRDDSSLWDKLLKGKTARIITTMDAPGWYYRLILRSPGHNTMKKAVLQFCGVKSIKITTFSSVKFKDKERREKWLEKVGSLGFGQN